MAHCCWKVSKEKFSLLKKVAGETETEQELARALVRRAGLEAVTVARKRTPPNGGTIDEHRAQTAKAYVGGAAEQMSVEDELAPRCWQNTGASRFRYPFLTTEGYIVRGLLDDSFPKRHTSYGTANGMAGPVASARRTVTHATSCRTHS